MNAKEIFERRKLAEAGEGEGTDQPMRGTTPPSGITSRVRPAPPRRPPEGMDDPDELMARMGARPRPMRPQEPMMGPFTVRDMSMLKDVLLHVVCTQAGNDYDGAIARQLMEGKPLEPGQVQHILDEASRVGGIPEQHGKVLQKAHEWLQSQPS